MVLKAAAAKVEITADRKTANDSLYAKILLLEKGDCQVALISVDYISLGGEIGTVTDAFYPILKNKLKMLGISHVICGTTHTHTFEPMVIEESIILQRIQEKAAQLINELQEVSVSYARGNEDSFLINRNIPLKNGGDWTIRLAHALPPECDYDKLSFADASLRVIQFIKADGEPLCIAFNFGCHPLLGYANNRATVNFPGVAERLIEKQTGALAMMFQSTGGDVCEIDYKNYFQAKDCTKHGVDLGLTVLETLAAMETQSSELSAITVQTEFPLRKDYQQEIEKIKEEQLAICNSMQNSPLNFKNFLPLYIKYIISPEYPLDHKYAYLYEQERGITQLKDQDELNRKHIEKYLKNVTQMEKLTRLAAEVETLEWHQKRVEKLGESVSAEITGIKIGDVILITAPFEPLTEIGVKLYEKYGEKVFLASYSNGYFHYGATDGKYKTGAYETRECDLSPEWQKAYFDAVDTIIERLRKGE